uniref:Uncharacterized protein n=1 Tax=Steinernema glaseri TaxID=37863 RepID=A0A1I7YYM6_9BILA
MNFSVQGKGIAIKCPDVLCLNTYNAHGADAPSLSVAGEPRIFIHNCLLFLWMDPLGGGVLDLGIYWAVYFILFVPLLLFIM